MSDSRFDGSQEPVEPDVPLDDASVADPSSNQGPLPALPADSPPESIWLDDDVEPAAPSAKSGSTLPLISPGRADALDGDHSAVLPPPPPPGPGLPEAVAWFTGVWIVQVVLSVIAAIVAFAIYAAASAAGVSDVTVDLRSRQSIASLQQQAMPLILVLSQGMFVVVVVAAAALRLGGKDAPRKLGVRAPSVGQVLGIVGVMLPLGLLSTQLYTAAEAYVWRPLVRMFPGLEVFDQINIVESMGEITTRTPTPLLFLAVAVAPAVAEELVFRGVIGRGLTARWGLPAGVAISSVLFAVVHMHPVHAAGVLLLGAAMHFLYITTRSIWAPMLLHLLNNGFSILATKAAGDANAQALGEGVAIPPSLIASSLFCVAALACWYWKTRVYYRLPTGEPWDPGYFTVERPPAELAAEAERTPASIGWLLTALAGFAIFAATWIHFAAETAKQQT